MTDLVAIEGTVGQGSRHIADCPVRVLVVDDEVGVLNAIARILRKAELIPHIVEDGPQALALLEREPIDVALIDVRMPGMTGPQLLAHMRAAGYPVEVIMMTAFADVQTTVSAVRQGAYGFITKPFSTNESVLIEVLNAASHKSLRERTVRLENELATLRTISCGSRSIEQVVASQCLHELPYADAKRRVVADFNAAYVDSLLRLTRGDVSLAADRSGLDCSKFRSLIDAETTPVDE